MYIYVYIYIYVYQESEFLSHLYPEISVTLESFNSRGGGKSFADLESRTSNSLQAP